MAATSFYAVPGLPGHLRPVTASEYDKAQEIIGIVCKYKGLDVNKVVARGRKRAMVYARSLAMWYMERETQLTLTAIAKLFNLRDHSTVIHSRITLQGLSDTYFSVRKDLSDIQKLINETKKENPVSIRPVEGQ